MPGQQPHDIELITYEAYEADRDSCLPSASISAGEKYTLRLQLPELNQTTEEYAVQLGSIALKIVHKEGFSVVRYVGIISRQRLASHEHGMTPEGIIFIRDPFPPDLTQIPHRNERGYFSAAGDPYENFLSELSRQPAEEEEELVVSDLPDLVLTR